MCILIKKDSKMYKYGIYTYLLREYVATGEFLCTLKGAKALAVKNLSMESVFFDFNSGEFEFEINTGNKKCRVFFHNESENINDFLRFLEEFCITGEAVILPMHHLSEETVFYIEPRENKQAVFAVIKNLSVEVCILMNEKKLIKGIYTSLKKFFEDYENIAYFEPPVIDFNYWIRKSEGIEKFIWVNRRRKFPPP